MKKMIEICGLSKSFGEIKAVKELTFHVNEGELFAFLGVNGAGKSTTINMMCGQLACDDGNIIINGLDVKSAPDLIKSSIGVVFQESVLDKALSVVDNLVARAALYGIYGKELKDRIDALAEMLDFKDLLKRTVGRLSGGQRRRVDIARALIHKPEILILDEPTTGLDPQTRRILWNVISELRKKDNMTVFLTTHYMEEAADADYVVIIDGGVKVAEGSPLELKNLYSRDYISLYGVGKDDVNKLEVPFEEIRDGYRLSVANTKEATALIVANPEIFCDYEITKGKMDDVFLAVTGKKLDGGEKK